MEAVSLQALVKLEMSGLKLHNHLNDELMNNLSGHDLEKICKNMLYFIQKKGWKKWAEKIKT